MSSYDLADSFMRPIDRKLLEACQNGDTATASTLLLRGAKPNCHADVWPYPTAFMIAAQKGDIEMLRLLAQHGADPHATDARDENALHYAVEYSTPETARFLITHLHLDPNIQGQRGRSPFLVAAYKGDLDMLRTLAQLGADPYATNCDGENALHHAAEKQHRDIARYLITELQLDPNARDQWGETPFMIAARNGDIKMLQLLIQLGANPNCRDRRGSTAIHYAVTYSHYDTVQFLITQLQLDPNIQERLGITPFLIAARNGDIKMLQRLIQLGANAYTTDKEGQKAIHYAVKNRQYAVTQYLIIQLQFDPNTQDDHGITPFLIATQNKDIRMLKLLLQLGANPHITDHQGRTALHYAKDPQTAHFLISALHLNPNIQDHHGNTPLLITRQNRNTHTAKTLIQLGAHLHIPNRQGQTPATIARQHRIRLPRPQPSTITL